MLISDFFEQCYRVRRLRGKSIETSRLYRVSIRNFEKTLCRRAELSDFTNENIGLHIQTMLDRGRAVATANKDRSQLLALWRFATRIGMLSTFPEVLPEREPERVPEAWMQDDLQILLSTIDKQDSMLGDVPTKLWWRGIISVCLDTGERIGAVVQLNWSWLERSWLLVPAEARKGGKRDRRYLLGEDTIQILKEIRKYNSGAKIFPWPYSKCYLWNKYTDLLKSAGLPHSRKDKFHRLRKTVGSVMYSAGMDAQDVLDHQHRRTTQRYLDPRFTRDQQPSDILAAWLRNPPKPNQGRKLG